MNNTEWNKEHSDENKKHQQLLPYHGKNVNYDIKPMKNGSKKLEIVAAQILFTGSYLGLCFHINHELRVPTYLLKHGTTWNDLQRARNDLKQSTASKKRPAKNILTSQNPPFSKIINWRAPVSQRWIPCVQYFVLSVHTWNNARQKNQNKCHKTKANQKKHWMITWLASHWSRWVGSNLFSGMSVLHGSAKFCSWQFEFSSQ